MTWLELSVSADNEAAEAVAEVLARFGYNGGVVVEPAWTPGDEGPEFCYDVTRPTTLRTYLPFDAQTEEIRQRVEQALWHLGQMRPVGPLQLRTLAEEDWANAWKQHYSVLRVGQRMVIVPSWLEHDSAPDDVVLHLDPGMAFGTGLHPTTRLCLALLEEQSRPGQYALDLGTGSGILAIALAKLGATLVVALDNDPVATKVAAENVALNHVADRVRVATGSLGAGSRMGHWLSGNFGDQAADEATDASAPTSGFEAKFELIVANLIARVLCIVAADLAANLAPGGLLISSGIIDTREEEVRSAFAAVGLRQVARHQEGEWLALVHTLC
ncbi:MAG: 50S ribosomal protein L11 methyltransferase [Candidatus Viridilinea halotolerans]|uniref:Ribosomal protein L11 methyltransferase n=1 Tax=Candidatus Viridilinea halotolerans TaxID=2491704 RepID=A0A426TQG0_9CHLR|nr:MAG: 50S ribosomal protein L11 methyltransferase [Candidatus Viridilinea halotolerans]